MKRHYYLFGLLIAGLFLFSSSSNNPPNGRTGAPGDGLCTDCHAGGNASQNGEIEVTGLPDIVSPGVMYGLTVTVRNPNGLASSAGFQMTILNGSDAAAGSLSNPGENATVTNSGGRQYFEHNPAVDFPGSNEVSWTVDWTAPDGPLESEVTFYAVGNASNGNGQNSGDLVITTSGTSTISETSSLDDLVDAPVRIFPNPASDYLQILDTGEEPFERFSIYNSRGVEVLQRDQPGSQKIDITNLEPGTYFLRILKGDQLETFQWIKI